jgi:HPr kinase/phosphorylase
MAASPVTADMLDLHATTVAVEGRGLLILGPSGSGKSALALMMMALGSVLVADDRTHVSREGGVLVASGPERLRGMIEARGVGLLAAEQARRATLALAVDLGQTETERLPPERTIGLLDLALPLLHKVESAHFPAALLQYLRFGRVA